MRQTVMALCLISIITLFNGCCPKPTPCPSIPQRCHVPYAELPIIDNTLCDDNNYSCIVVKTLSNYEALKAYAETLKTNSDVCR